MEETTDGMMGYAQILIDQYHGLMDGMADDMDALKAAVQSDMGNVKEITSQATAHWIPSNRFSPPTGRMPCQRSPAWRICKIPDADGERFPYAGRSV